MATALHTTPYYSFLVPPITEWLQKVEFFSLHFSTVSDIIVSRFGGGSVEKGIKRGGSSLSPYKHIVSRMPVFLYLGGGTQLGAMSMLLQKGYTVGLTVEVPKRGGDCEQQLLGSVRLAGRERAWLSAIQ